MEDDGQGSIWLRGLSSGCEQSWHTRVGSSPSGSGVDLVIGETPDNLGGVIVLVENNNYPGVYPPTNSDKNDRRMFIDQNWVYYPGKVRVIEKGGPFARIHMRCVRGEDHGVKGVGIEISGIAAKTDDDGWAGVNLTGIKGRILTLRVTVPGRTKPVLRKIAVPIVCARPGLVHYKTITVDLSEIRRAIGGRCLEEGSVGGGTGMICSEFKGGIGTRSRVLDVKDGGYTVGVLVQCNYGDRDQLRIAGVNVGRENPGTHRLEK